jgi:endonuclease/exonuclease/phosphatase family metal-dependent hydrolase
VINAANPVLVALQEVDSGTTRASGKHQELELAHLTNMQVAFFAEAIPYADGSYGDAILSRWPVVESEAIALPAAPNHEKRVAVIIVVEEPSTGRQIRFVGTHLDHTKDPADRIWQVQELSKALLPATMPTLLVGDLNSQPDSQPMQLLFDAGWIAADADLQPTFPSAGANKKIDWFLRAPGQGDSLMNYRVLNAPLASDHSPIVVTWVVPAQD